jgi:hypothetical protein
VKGKWTAEEDARLVEVVHSKLEHWGKVAEKMPGRTSKQCRERWSNYLDPSLRKDPFSIEEDQLILRLQAEYGNKWAQISRSFSGRTENSIKLRYNSLAKHLRVPLTNRNVGQQQQLQHQQEHQGSVLSGVQGKPSSSSTGGAENVFHNNLNDIPDRKSLTSALLYLRYAN